MLSTSSSTLLSEIRNEIRGRLTVPREPRLGTVALNEFLKRLDAAAHDTRVGGQGSPHVTRAMTLVASPLPQCPTLLHTRGERAEPLGKHRLPGAYSWRKRVLCALCREVRRDRCRRTPRVAHSVVACDRFGVRLEERHHAGVGRWQRLPLGEADRPAARRGWVPMACRTGHRVRRIGRLRPPPR